MCVQVYSEVSYVESIGWEIGEEARKLEHRDDWDIFMELEGALG